MDFLTAHWAGIVLAINWIAAKIDTTGMLDVTATADWGRLVQGGHNTEANALLYRVLMTGAITAGWVNDATGLGTKWTAQAQTLKTAVKTNNWDATIGCVNIYNFHTSLEPLY